MHFWSIKYLLNIFAVGTIEAESIQVTLADDTAHMSIFAVGTCWQRQQRNCHWCALVYCILQCRTAILIKNSFVSYVCIFYQGWIKLNFNIKFWHYWKNLSKIGLAFILEFDEQGLSPCVVICPKTNCTKNLTWKKLTSTISSPFAQQLYSLNQLLCNTLHFIGQVVKYYYLTKFQPKAALVMMMWIAAKQ